MDQDHITFIVTLVVTVIVTLGPLMAWMQTKPDAQAHFRKRQDAFSAGKGKDPAREPFGPGRSFMHNAVVMGLMSGASAALVAVVMTLAR